MQPGNFFHFLLLFFRLPVGLHGNAPIPKEIRRLRLSLIMVFLSLFIGTLGFVLIESYPWLDAWYMAVITLASVGFGEVHPLSDAGRIFTSFLILFNVGLFAYSISTITSVFAEGGLTKLMNNFRMERHIAALRGHTIVCGYGRHATEVAQELAKQNIAFVIIENKSEKVDALRHETNYLFIEGDATHDDVLEYAGIRYAEALVVTLPSDADNLFIVLSARQMNPGMRIISRANNEADERKIRRAGANHTVVPERIGGFYMATLVNKPDLVEFFTLLSNMGPSNVVFEEIPIENLQPQFHQKPLTPADITLAGRVPVVAVRRPDGQYQLNPAPETVLLPRWHIVVLGNPEQMSFFRANVLTADG